MALALFAGWQKQLELQLLIVFSSAIFAQLIILFVFIKNKDWLILLIQSLLFIALVFYSGNLQSDLIWAAIMPVLGIGIRKGVIAVLGTTAGIFLGLYYIFSSTLSPVDYLKLIWMPFTLILITGLILAFLFNKLAMKSIQKKDIERSKEEDSIRLDRQRNKSLFEVSETLNAALDFDHVLELALDLIDNSINENTTQLNNLQSSILLVNKQGFGVSAARRYSYADLDINFEAEKGLLAEVANEGKSQILHDPKSDSELARISFIHTANIALCLPLNSGMDLFGLLLLTHEERNYFTQDRMIQIEAIAQQLSSALKNAQLYESLEYEKERISHIEEQARRQLARNLHDGPTQSIAAIAMRVNLARRLMVKDKDGASDELFKVEELARRTTKEIRHMLFTLRPEILEKEGFAPAMRDLASQIEDNYQRSIQINLEAKAIKGMDLGRQGVLFNVVVEALTNALKHAEADNISFKLKQIERDVAHIEIKDDGKGFVPFSEEFQAPHNDQSGIRNMQDRVELLNGLFRIESSLGMGCKIQIWIPMNEKAAMKLRQGLNVQS